MKITKLALGLLIFGSFSNSALGMNKNKDQKPFFSSVKPFAPKHNIKKYIKRITYVAVAVGATYILYKSIEAFFATTPSAELTAMQKELAPFNTHPLAVHSFAGQNTELISLIEQKYQCSPNVAVVRACNAVEEDQRAIADIINSLGLLRVKVANDEALVQACDEVLRAAERIYQNLMINADILQTMLKN